MQDENPAVAMIARRDALLRAATLIEFQARQMRERMSIALAQIESATVPSLLTPAANGRFADQNAQMQAAAAQNMTQFEGALISLTVACEQFVRMVRKDSTANDQGEGGPPPFKITGG